MMARSTQQNTSELPTDISRLLDCLDQYIDDTDVSAGGRVDRSELAKAARRHELNAYDMIKSAAYRVVAETGSDIYVVRPNQPYIYSKDGIRIKPDVLVIITEDNKPKYTIVADAKNHQKYIPPKDWIKALRDMIQTGV